MFTGESGTSELYLGTDIFHFEVGHGEQHADAKSQTTGSRARTTQLLIGTYLEKGGCRESRRTQFRKLDTLFRSVTVETATENVATHCRFDLGQAHRAGHPLVGGSFFHGVSGTVHELIGTGCLEPGHVKADDAGLGLLFWVPDNCFLSPTFWVAISVVSSVAPTLSTVKKRSTREVH